MATCNLISGIWLLIFCAILFLWMRLKIGIFPIFPHRSTCICCCCCYHVMKKQERRRQRKQPSHESNFHCTATYLAKLICVSISQLAHLIFFAYFKKAPQASVQLLLIKLLCELEDFLNEILPSPSPFSSAILHKNRRKLSQSHLLLLPWTRWINFQACVVVFLWAFKAPFKFS